MADEVNFCRSVHKNLKAILAEVVVVVVVAESSSKGKVNRTVGIIFAHETLLTRTSAQICSWNCSRKTDRNLRRPHASVVYHPRFANAKPRSVEDFAEGKRSAIFTELAR